MSNFKPRPRNPRAPATRPLDVPAPIAPRSSTGYDRERDLPRLIRVWPDQLASADPMVRGLILRRIYAALRAERQRGREGHWTYDVARHSQLLSAYRQERARISTRR